MVLSIRVRDAAYGEATDNFVTRAFDFAHRMLADLPSDLGEHAHLRG